jgi:hypothetical protein
MILARRLSKLEKTSARARETREQPMAEVRIISSATGEIVQHFFTPWGEPNDRRRGRTKSSERRPNAYR